MRRSISRAENTAGKGSECHKAAVVGDTGGGSVQGYVRTVHQYPDQAAVDGFHRVCGTGCELPYFLKMDSCDARGQNICCSQYHL